MKMKFDGKFKFLKCLDGRLGEREREYMMCTVYRLPTLITMGYITVFLVVKKKMCQQPNDGMMMCLCSKHLKHVTKFFRSFRHFTFLCD